MSIDTPARPSEVEEEVAARSARGGLRALALRLHFYAGLLIAPFLLVVATTGLLYAGSWQAEKIIYSEQLKVPVGGSVLALEQQVEAAKAARPDGKVLAVRPSASKGETTRVLMMAPGLGEEEKLAVYVDPYTAKVKGDLPVYGGSEALPVRAWLSKLHAHLHLGEPGRIYSEMAASWLWAVVLGGLILWVGRRRKRKRELLLPESGVKGLKRTLSWHGTVGIWAAVGLLFLSITGLTWSVRAGARIDKVQEGLSAVAPKLPGTSVEHHEGASGSGHAGHTLATANADQVLAAAGLAGPTEISYPVGQGKAFVVKQIDKQWPMRQDSVAIDPATAAVTGELRYADYPVFAKLTSLGIAGHQGQLFGLANQVLLAALALGLIFMIVWGYRMWWQRGRHGFGKPAGRGAWRQTPGWTLALVGAFAIAAGWLVPLFGYTLAGFLVLDLIMGRVRSTS